MPSAYYVGTFFGGILLAAEIIALQRRVLSSAVSNVLAQSPNSHPGSTCMVCTTVRPHHLERVCISRIRSSTLKVRLSSHQDARSEISSSYTADRRGAGNRGTRGFCEQECKMSRSHVPSHPHGQTPSRLRELEPRRSSAISVAEIASRLNFLVDNTRPATRSLRHVMCEEFRDST